MLKAVNVLNADGMLHSQVIEDMVVFTPPVPVTDVFIHHSEAYMGEDRLVVSSRKQIKSLPLHRCQQYVSCQLVS